jgi:predicted phosphoribosyltransferase
MERSNVRMFASREDAGQQLGRLLRERRVQAGLVLGLPRGGVVVAAATANVLHLPLGVLVVRKIGHPLHREFAVGALAEGNVVVLDECHIGANPIIRAELEQILEEERGRLQAYRSRFHRAHAPSLAGKTVLLVDDGLATGSTAEAAVLSARKQGAQRVIVAAPVASTNAVERLARVADDVIVQWADPAFEAVGAYYQSFLQTTDEEVLDLLSGVRNPPPLG